MSGIILTQYDGAILGPIAKVLGWIMNAIFNLTDVIGIPNIGLSIILFTIVVYLLMLPLTIKQQKFSKLSAKMNPEIQAIQKKYEGKKDENSVMAQNQEIQMVYAKYGVSPSGSCVQLIIQMPILFALYRVISNVPAYVTKVKSAFLVLAEKIFATDQGLFLQNSEVEGIKNTVAMYGQKMSGDNTVNGIIDVLDKLSSADLATVAQHYDLSALTYEGELILSNDVTTGLLDTYNNFLGLNMANSPQAIITSAFAIGAWGLVIGAVLIPVLSALTQWINVKLMPQQENQNQSAEQSSMAQSMKTMNMIMPFMSAWFCFTLPCGMGLYWIAGSVVRTIQQIAINKYIDRMDFDKLVAKNSEKSAKKIAKMEEQQKLIEAYSNMNTKKIQSKANQANPYATQSQSDVKTNSETYYKNAKPGSMMAKANMVKDFNEKNNK